MISRGYKIQGVVIKRINFSETDKILTIFSIQKGKMVCLAKGIRKVSSKRAPSVELFNCIKAYVAKGRGMDILTEVELIQCFPKLQEKLSAICSTYYLVEIVDRLTAEDQRNPLIYDLLMQFLSKIDKNGNLQTEEIIDFQKKILTNLGFGLPAQINKQSLEWHIENIINRKINSKSFLRENI